MNNVQRDIVENPTARAKVQFDSRQKFATGNNFSMPLKINVLFLWGIVSGIYFAGAYFYIWKKTGVNLWKFWWSSRCDNLKTERKFAEEIRKFPKLNIGYQFIKWGTLAVVLGYLVYVFRKLAFS